AVQHVVDVHHTAHNGPLLPCPRRRGRSLWNGSHREESRGPASPARQTLPQQLGRGLGGRACPPPANFQPRFTASCTPVLRPWPPCGGCTCAASPASRTRPWR